jgi:hypothetical protein
LVIPKLDAFESTFTGEVDDVVISFRRNPVADDKFLRGARTEMDHDTVNENSLTTHPQLNSAKEATTTGNLDPAVALTTVDLREAQEIPNLPVGKQRGGKNNDQEPVDGSSEA